MIITEGSYLDNNDLQRKTIDDEKKPHQFISMPGINRFGERLKLIMGNESNRSFARKCNLSDSVIGNYVAGKTYPSLDKIEVLAIAGGVVLSG